MLMGVSDAAIGCFHFNLSFLLEIKLPINVFLNTGGFFHCFSASLISVSFAWYGNCYNSPRISRNSTAKNGANFIIFLGSLVPST